MKSMPSQEHSFLLFLIFIARKKDNENFPNGRNNESSDKEIIKPTICFL